MNYKRIGRALICLVLVCALLVNVSPIKAEALVPESMVISAGLVVGSILVGLGIGMASDSTANVISGLVDDCVSVIQSDYDFIDEEGLVEIYADYSAATAQYYVNQAMVEAVRDWMFESETVTGGDVAEEGNQYYGSESLPDISSASSKYPDRSAHVIYFSRSNACTYLMLIEPRDSFYLGVESNGYFLAYNGNSYSRFYLNEGEWEKDKSDTSGFASYNFGMPDQSCDILWTNMDVLGSDGSVYFASSDPSSTLPISVSEGLTAYQIAPKDEDFSTGYSEWSAGAVTVPAGTAGNASDITALPIGIGKDLSETISATQADVWAGVSTYTGTDVVVPDIPAISDALGDTSTSVFLNALADTIETLPLIPTHIEDAIEQLPAYVSDIRDYIETLPEWQDVITDHIEQLPGQIADIRDFIETLPEWQDSLLDHIEILPDRFSTAFDDVKIGIGTIADTLTGSITGALTDIQAIGVDIGTKVQAIPDVIAKAISDAKAAVVEAVEAAVIPEKDYLTSKVNALREEFAFADSIVRTGEALQLGLAGISTTPPVIYIHLGDTEGSYNIGGTVPFLDLRWYARYKPTVDTLISAFLWICFVWRMLVKLPGIISGMPGDFVMASAHQMGVTDYLPTRSKEYEIQRISNRETIRKGPGK